MLKFFKVSFAVLTACLTIGSLSSFTNLDDTWYYHGPNDETEFNNPDHWLPTEPANVSCGGSINIPCMLNQTVSENDLPALLADHPESDIFDIANKRK